jgi:hypothetical protein
MTIAAKIPGSICIVKCLANFRDGNCVIKEAKAGETFEIPAGRWEQLKNSAPFSWELVEVKIPRPSKGKAKNATPKK